MKILEGISQLLQSPSGIFSLLSLAALSVVSWHSPTVGTMAFPAFFAIVPATLAYIEHKEEMAKINK